MDTSFDYNGNKSFRILNIYERLQQGEYLNKSELAADYSVTEKTIQRDINDLRAYLLETHIYDSDMAIKYDKSLNKYYLSKSEQDKLSNYEVLAICKIILESRSMSKEKISEIIQKILNILNTYDRNIINNAILTDIENYSPITDSSDITLKLWQTTKYIKTNSFLFLSYSFPNETKHNYLVYPISIIYRQNKFFLVAYSKENDDFPTVFSFNEIVTIKPVPPSVINETHPKTLSEDAFEIKPITFRYAGNFMSLMSKFPTAKLLDEHCGIYTIRSLYIDDLTIDWMRKNKNVVSIL